MYCLPFFSFEKGQGVSEKVGALNEGIRRCKRV